MIFLDDTFFDHPKVIAAGDDAAVVYLKGLGWLKQQRSTDGRIPKGVLPRLAPIIRGRLVPAAPLAERLVGVTLWHDEGTHWRCHDYVIKNARSLAKSKQASEAANARWSKEAERLESERNAGADAGAERAQMQQSPSPSPQSPPPQSSSDPEPEIPGLDDASHIVAGRKMSYRNGSRIIDEEAWMAVTTAQVRDQYAAKARFILSQEPDLTPVELANRLEPPPATIKPFSERNWDDEPEVDPEVVKAMVSEARAALGQE